MYFHIGKETIIPLNEVIIILNLEKILEKNNFNDIIKELKIENDTIDISEGNKKTLIVVKNKQKIKGYISNISSTTLEKRINKNKI